MQKSSSSCAKNTPNDGNVAFPFPYPTPYPIQSQFMSHLYNILQKESSPRFAIMQSPTGSGKSLSLICSALKWLRERHQNGENANASDDDEPEWVREHDSNKRKRHNASSMQQHATKRKKVNQLVSVMGASSSSANSSGRKLAPSSENDDDLLLHEEEETTSSNTGLSPDLIKELYADEISEMTQEAESAQDTFQTPKIIYCSRTHSQITQFVKEFQKTEFSKGDDAMTLIPLASRKNLCVHPKVKRITSSQMQMDRCQQLRSQKKCDYYDKSGLTLFTQHALNKPHDIEDLVKIGRRIEACAYFGSRKALGTADLILMPYSSLVNERMRHSLGVESLEDCVVIIDEAHNLVDAIGSVHAASLSKKQLSAALQQLNRYVNKYKNRLRRGTLNKAQQLLRIMKQCLTFIHTIQSSKVHGVNDFLYETKLEDINLFEIQRFIDQTRLAQKLNGFIDRYKDESVAEGDELMQNCIHPTLAFLLTLTNVGSDGRLLLQKDPSGRGNHSLQFLLLKPSVYFESICKEAHSVILTGGTMEPIQTVIQQLFPARYQSDVSIFQCGHVIPDDHLLPICLTHSGSSGTKFNFNFQNRNNDAMILSLGKCISEFCHTVPGGIVCFFPSYAYEELIYQKWKKAGYIRKIEESKTFFREPKKSKDVDSVLAGYKKSIDEAKQGVASGAANLPFTGSFLSCVIGGKMSEGINFSDDYGRLVCIVGLPYPNKNDAALCEKMKFLDTHVGKNAGSQYYQDLCMNAVNQSIGRSIRHASDFASIVLIDERYGQKKIQQQLPQWIQDKKVRTCSSLESANGMLKEFVKGKPVLKEM